MIEPSGGIRYQGYYLLFNKLVKRLDTISFMMLSETTANSDQLELPYRSKTDLVTDYLRQELQVGRPPAGERLVVSHVAHRLGVSKVPVREAVTRLIGEGLLELRPNVGAVVPEFSAHEVIETALMRVAMDRLALETAVPLHTAESFRAIESILDEMSTATIDFPTLNVRFHVAMIQPSPYKEAVRTAGMLLERAQRFRTTQIVPGYQPHAHLEHVELFECIRAGDLELLQHMNERHIMDAAHKLTGYMAREDGMASDS